MTRNELLVVFWSGVMAATLGCSPGQGFGAAACREDDDCLGTRVCSAGSCVRDDDDDDKGPGPDGDGDPSDPSDDEPVVDPPPAPDGPQFLSLTTNTSRLTPSGSLVVTAVLTDGDGIDDIIGGSLDTPNHQNSYGAFQTSAAEGSYQLTLTWGDFDAVAPIEFLDSDARQVSATFYDAAGHQSVRSLTITLACSDGGPACDAQCGRARCDGTCEIFPSQTVDVCGGQCVSVVDDDDCGSCGNVCTNGTTCDVGETETVCRCDDGTQCGAGTLCVEPQYLTATRCLQASIATPSVDTDTFAPTLLGERLCQLHAPEVDLVCQRAGYNSAVFQETEFGVNGHFTIECYGASNLDDCVYWSANSLCSAVRLHCQ